MHTTLFFASRYIFATDRKSSLASLVALCFWSIMLATLFLTLIAAIMQGFQRATYTTLQNIHADLIVSGRSNDHLNFAAIHDVLQREFNEITAAAPRASACVILQSTNNTHDQQIITLQAFDAYHEARTTEIQKTVCKPREQELNNLLSGQTLLIGKPLADNLCLAVGDALTVYYAPNDGQGQSPETLTFNKHTVLVSGIFSTGITDYDASVAWTSFELFHELFPEDGVTTIGLKLAPTADTKHVQQRLAQRLKLDVTPWYDLYPALVQALHLEHHALLIVLFLIVALASLTMASTLMLHMEQKKTDIALLRAMGMPMRTATAIFMVIGLCIASAATTCGMLAGLCISTILNTYKLISLPDAYYISYVPAHLTPSYFLLLFVLAHAVSLVVVWYTVRKGRTHSLSTLLREHS